MGGMTRLLLLLWVGVTASTVVDLQKRVIGGSPCGQDQRQYHVGLIETNGGRPYCGGSLIKDQWILTAAHCLDRNMIAVLGRAPGEVKEVTITAEPKIFESAETHKRHDIMLLKLPDGTTIPHKVESVLLPVCGQRPKTNDTVQIAGYYATVGPKGEKVTTTSNILYCADTDIADTERSRACLKNDDPDYYQMNSHEHWIFGKRTGVDTSPGDSGGGVVYNGMIYGVHSFTGNETHACAAAAGFMDVCEYMKWIHETIAPPTV